MKLLSSLKHLTLVTLSVVMLVGVALPPATAHADTIPPACTDGDILRYLWAGANFTLNVHEACPGTPSNTPGSGASGNKTGYYALGDSVAAGLGLPGSGQASGTDPACGVSTEAYPYLVASATGQSVTSLACSGATTGDLLTDQNVGGHEVGAQLDRAFTGGTPSLITITVGANDMQWVTFLRKCYTSQCGTNLDTTATSLLRQTMASKLSTSLDEIQRRSNGSPPPVIMTGYYHPVSPLCNLAANNITQAEIDWMNNQLDLLNQAIAQTVSHYGFAHFAPIDFSNHELCTADSWVQGPNDAAPFHPTNEGQQAIASAVEAQIR